MQFNNTTLKNGIIQNCERMTSLGIGNISGDTGLLAEFTDRVNQAYTLAIAWIMEVQGGWKYDDSNYTDSLPEATCNLVDGQSDYSLPGATTGANFSTFLRLVGVKVMDKDGKYKDLSPLLPEDERLLANTTDTGMPNKYKLVGNQLILSLTPSVNFVTLTDGLKVLYQRVPDMFLSTDTSQEPGINMSFQRIIPLLASYNYLIDNRVFDLAAARKADIYGDTQTGDIGLKAEMQKFYATRNEDTKPRMQARSRRTRYD